MEIITFTTRDTDGWQSPRVGALLNSEYLLDFERAFDGGERPPNHLAWLDMDGPWFQRSRKTYETLVPDSRLLAQAIEKGWLTRRSEAYWLAPVPRPGKLICIGLNYRDHAAESNMAIPERPVVFSKFATRALEYVLGYTAFNDVSARDFQFADGQWQRGKSCDTFAPMGPTIVTADVIPNPHKLSIKLRLNGRTMQDSNTDNLIFGIPQLISFLSETITLEPGDVIATGTPSGVGFARKPPVFLKDGDQMEVEIEGLGILNSRVVAAVEAVGSSA